MLREGEVAGGARPALRAQVALDAVPAEAVRAAQEDRLEEDLSAEPAAEGAGEGGVVAEGGQAG